jgi:predicted AAA+ superfamily ATPase
LYFWRDSTGNEVDVVFETSDGLQAIEIKSGSTFAPDWIKGLNKWQSIAGVSKRQPQIIYGSATGYERESCQVVGWQMGEHLSNFQPLDI